MDCFKHQVYCSRKKNMMKIQHHHQRSKKLFVNFNTIAYYLIKKKKKKINEKTTNELIAFRIKMRIRNKIKNEILLRSSFSSSSNKWEWNSHKKLCQLLFRFHSLIFSRFFCGILRCFKKYYLCLPYHIWPHSYSHVACYLYMCCR